MAGVFSLDEEIALVHQLDAVISMDSFNMHLAALCDTKVISIWGGTHSFAGFGPLNNNEQFIVEVAHDELDCRPCSVFGSKPCYRGDWACLKRIEVADVLKMLE
jgi:ADP-heptose:LPS heptosyltransferase